MGRLRRCSSSGAGGGWAKRSIAILACLFSFATPGSMDGTAARPTKGAISVVDEVFRAILAERAPASFFNMIINHKHGVIQPFPLRALLYCPDIDVSHLPITCATLLCHTLYLLFDLEQD